jgi:hypothetical protein
MGGRRKSPPRPLDLAWIGKYVRLWHDRGKNRFVEGLVEKSVVSCGYPAACVLRVPGSPGYTVLSEARDIEEIVPTQELLEALTKYISTCSTSRSEDGAANALAYTRSQSNDRCAGYRRQPRSDPNAKGRRSSPRRNGSCGSRGVGLRSAFRQVSRRSMRL